MTPSFVNFSYRCILSHLCGVMDIIFAAEDVDDGNVTQNYEVEVDFDQYICASHRDRNLIGGMMGYVENIQEITQVDFSSFQCVIFRCKWWDTFDRNNVKKIIIVG